MYFVSGFSACSSDWFACHCPFPLSFLRRESTRNNLCAFLKIVWEYTGFVVIVLVHVLWDLCSSWVKAQISCWVEALLKASSITSFYNDAMYVLHFTPMYHLILKLLSWRIWLLSKQSYCALANSLPSGMSCKLVLVWPCATMQSPLDCLPYWHF